MPTRVRLLGPPAIEFDGERAWPKPGKTSALLLYLAYQGDWVARVELADLFWRDADEGTGRGNLRSLLSRTVSTRPFAKGLEVEATRVRWQVPTDLRDFESAAASGAHAEAFRAYGGELLSGFVLERAPGFEEWLAGERTALHERWRDAALEVCDRLEAAEEWSRSVEVLRRLMEADRFDEEVLRRLLGALANSGRPDRARQEYERFRSWLADEVGAEPEAATTGLAVGSVPAATASAGANLARSDGAAGPRIPLPAWDIIGRAEERAQIAALLEGPEARLVTLAGPGGIGKTRLALAVAGDLDAADAQHSDSTPPHGRAVAAHPSTRAGLAGAVWFVPCETLTKPDDLVGAVADAVGLPLVGPGEPLRQLLDLLSEWRALFVLDNLDQLRGRPQVLDRLLEAAPGVSILVTSRELVGSRYERVVDVAGLGLPSDEDPTAASAAMSPAVQLFVACGRRVRPDYVLEDEDIEHVIRICRLVDGLPLAIELAAGWLRAVSPLEIAEEIARGLDILKAAAPAEGDRHRSVRAALDHSWEVLSSLEQRGLARLSVFAGSFDLSAATAVAEVSLTTVTGLVNKSLVASPRPGRYRLHPLVRAHAAENLASEVAGTEPRDGDVPLDAGAVTRAAHLAHFASFLEQQAAPLAGGEQLRAVNQIAEVAEDVRTAWETALEGRDTAALDRLAPTLAVYFTFRSRFREMLSTFSAGVALLRAAPQTARDETLLGFLLSHVGWSSMRFGRYQEAEAALLEAQATSLGGALEPRYPAGDPRLPLSLMASIRGEFEAAERFAARALKASREHGNTLNERIAHYALARSAIGEERFDDAAEHVRLALVSSELAGDRWFQGDCLLELGDVEAGLGRLEEADHHYLRGLKICAGFGNRSGVAEAMNRRAALALLAGERESARRLYLESLEASRAVGDGREIARAECGLAEVMSAADENRQAARHYRVALRHAARLRSLPLVRRIAEGAFKVAPERVKDRYLRRIGGGDTPGGVLMGAVGDLELALALTDTD